MKKNKNWDSSSSMIPMDRWVFIFECKILKKQKINSLLQPTMVVHYFFFPTAISKYKNYNTEKKGKKEMSRRKGCNWGSRILYYDCQFASIKKSGTKMV